MMSAASGNTSQLILSVNPFKCRMWDLHDRLDCELNEVSCRAEIDSILEHGQLVPVLGRRVPGDPDYEFELIYGARRLFIARHLNRPLRVAVREISDRDAIIAMDVENRLRKDISPYERGISYTRCLRSGHFKSQEDMARALRVSASQVSRLMRLAKLPAVVVAAFRSAADICENWGLELMDLLENEERREATIRTARLLSHRLPRLPGRDVYSALVASDSGQKRPASRLHDKVVVGRDGQPLFRVRRQTNSIALILPTGKISGRILERIETQLTDLLQVSHGTGTTRLAGGTKVGEISNAMP